MYRGIKIQIYPTTDQIELINTNINIFRGVYNLVLGLQLDNYSKGNSYIKFYEMCKIISNLRNNNENYRWLQDTTIGVIREALLNVDTAFQMFFNKITKFPKFKSKKRSKKCFSTRSDRCYSDGNYVYVSGVGRIYCKNNKIPEDTRLHNVYISFDGYDKYYLSCSIDRDIQTNNEYHTGVIGIDVGIRNMITTSDGDFYHFSDTTFYEKRLKRQNKRLLRYCSKYLEEARRTKTKYEDIPKSKNMQKFLNKFFKTHQKIKNKRYNDIHVATKSIISKSPKTIVIEDLDVLSIQNTIHKSVRPLVYFSEIHRQLIYKGEERGINVIKATRGYPSTQRCSCCGNIRKVYGSQYKCKNCGLSIDRDLISAYNLRDFGINNIF